MGEVLFFRCAQAAATTAIRRIVKVVFLIRVKVLVSNIILRNVF